MSALLAVAVASSAVAENCDGYLCGARALVPFFRTLEGRTALPGAPSVRILEIGDSHSANDAIAGAWREALQARYGESARGVLPPGSPYWGFKPRQVQVSQYGPWTVQATFGHDAVGVTPGTIFGISGYRLIGLAGAGFALSAEPEAAFQEVVVCAVTAPGAGSYTLSAGGKTTTISLDGPDGVDCHDLRTDDLQNQVALDVITGEATILSWATFRPGGVTLSNLGVVGSQFRHFGRTSDVAVARELAAYAPDLIVLEFGTNEGFSSRFDGAAYEASLRAQIERIRRLSHDTPILLLTAPEAQSNRVALARNGDPDGGEASVPSGGWFEPPALAEVRAIQRRIALQTGVAFWDWGAAMGEGTADAWANADPPLMRRDHVHYTDAGGKEIARRLEADLEAADQRVFSGS
jgi:lysophospholipase L1-like esterase